MSGRDTEAGGAGGGTDSGGRLARRTFVRSLGRASAGLVCAGMVLPLAGCAGVPYAPATLVRGRLRVAEGSFGEGGEVLVDHPRDARPILVRRAPDGRYTAVSTRCSHRGCQVAPRGDRLACPCHGSEYTLEGDVLQGPAERPLRSFPTEVRGGAVLIDLSEDTRSP